MGDSGASCRDAHWVTLAKSRVTNMRGIINPRSYLLSTGTSCTVARSEFRISQVKTSRRTRPSRSIPRRHFPKSGRSTIAMAMRLQRRTIVLHEFRETANGLRPSHSSPQEGTNHIQEIQPCCSSGTTRKGSTASAVILCQESRRAARDTPKCHPSSRGRHHEGGTIVLVENRSASTEALPSR